MGEHRHFSDRLISNSNEAKFSSGDQMSVLYPIHSHPDLVWGRKMPLWDSTATDIELPQEVLSGLSLCTPSRTGAGATHPAGCVTWHP